MNIAFVTYWGLNEGLTQATVLPHIEILSKMDEVNSIHLFTMERFRPVPHFTHDKVFHHPIKSKNTIFSKLFDQNRTSNAIEKEHKISRFDLVIIRAQPAGWLIEPFLKKSKIPFVVESFEPHADYMAEDGVWKKSGLKYRQFHNSTKWQMQHAKLIMPLSEKYRLKLIHENHIDPNRLKTMPCSVDSQHFQFDQNDRTAIRAQLNVSDSTPIGIYTGKAGGMYYDVEAVKLFSNVLTHFKSDFLLLILSPNPEQWRKLLLKGDFPTDKFFLKSVAQNEVSAFLSAADFGFSLHRPTPSKIAISPIKNAEYWASGLPILMPDGIGDDSEITEIHKLGAVFNTLDDQAAFQRISSLIQTDRINNTMTDFAKKERSFDRVKEIYSALVSS